VYDDGLWKMLEFGWLFEIECVDGFNGRRRRKSGGGFYDSI